MHTISKASSCNYPTESLKLLPFIRRALTGIDVLCRIIFYYEILLEAYLS